MNDSFAGDFNATQTAGAASEQKAEGIAPILLKQLAESPPGENNFQMWGMTFGMVSCVVIVRSIEMSSTKITYLLEDSSGRIEAHYWLEEENQTKSPDVMLNNYAKVYGSVRSQGSQKTLMVFKILPIGDPNEITTHILEVLNARFKAEQFAMRGDASSSGGAHGFTEGFGSRNTADGNNLGLDNKQLAVFQAIKNFLSEEGISRQDLQRKFAHMKGELNNILDFLISEGHVYSSVDPDHFLSTE